MTLIDRRVTFSRLVCGEGPSSARSAHRLEFLQASLRVRTKTQVSINPVTHWHSGYESLEALAQKRLHPAPDSLLSATTAGNEVRAGVEPTNLPRAPAGLCTSAHDGGPRCAKWAASLIVDGLH